MCVSNQKTISVNEKTIAGPFTFVSFQLGKEGSFFKQKCIQDWLGEGGKKKASKPVEKAISPSCSGATWAIQMRKKKKKKRGGGLHIVSDNRDDYPPCRRGG